MPGDGVAGFVLFGEDIEYGVHLRKENENDLLGIGVQ